jgi:hypothetical protein
VESQGASSFPPREWENGEKRNWGDRFYSSFLKRIVRKVVQKEELALTRREGIAQKGNCPCGTACDEGHD